MTHPNFVSKLHDNISGVSPVKFCITFVIQTYYVLLDMCIGALYSLDEFAQTANFGSPKEAGRRLQTIREVAACKEHQSWVRIPVSTTLCPAHELSPLSQSNIGTALFNDFILVSGRRLNGPRLVTLCTASNTKLNIGFLDGEDGIRTHGGASFRGKSPLVPKTSAIDRSATSPFGDQFRWGRLAPPNHKTAWLW
jgi:hypothetical protein